MIIVDVKVIRRMAYNENCPMFAALPKWVRIVLAWEIG